LFSVVTTKPMVIAPSMQSRSSAVSVKMQAGAMAMPSVERQEKPIFNALTKMNTLPQKMMKEGTVQMSNFV